MNNDLIHKIKRQWMRLRLQPVHVYCFHHITEVYDAESMKKCDWMNLSEFKAIVEEKRRKGVEFISLDAAYRHICYDMIRVRKYASITFDDGYASLREVVAWLMDQKIPVTLFVNPKYLDGKSYRDNPKEQYLTGDELKQMTKMYGALLSIQSHGWEHTDAAKMTAEELKANIEKTIEALTPYTTHSIPVQYHAYTWGSYTKENDAALRSIGIIPVRINGRVNYNDNRWIDREHF